MKATRTKRSDKARKKILMILSQPPDVITESGEGGGRAGDSRAPGANLDGLTGTRPRGSLMRRSGLLTHHSAYSRVAEDTLYACVCWLPYTCLIRRAFLALTEGRNTAGPPVAVAGCTGVHGAWWGNPVFAMGTARTSRPAAPKICPGSDQHWMRAGMGPRASRVRPEGIQEERSKSVGLGLEPVVSAAASLPVPPTVAPSLGTSSMPAGPIPCRRTIWRVPDRGAPPALR